MPDTTPGQTPAQPPVQTPAQPPVQQQSQPTPQKSFKGRKKTSPALIAGIIIAVIVIAGAIYFAFSSGVSLDLGSSSEQNIKSAFQKTLEEKTVKVNLTLDIEGETTPEGRETQPMDLSIRFTGNISSDADQKRPGEGAITVAGTIGGESINAVIEYRRVPPKTYLLFGKDSVVAGLPFDLSSFFGQWVYFEDPEDGTSENIVPIDLPIDLSCERNNEAVQDYIESLDFAMVFSKVKKIGAIEVTEPDGDSEKATYYETELNVDQMKEIGERINELSGCPSDSDSESNIELESLNIAVGDTSGYIRSIDVVARGTGEFKGTYKANLILSDFGESPNVVAPPSSRSIEELFTESFFGSFLEGAGGTMFGGTDTGGTEAMEENNETLTDEDLADILKELENLKADFQAEFPQ